MVFRDVTCRRRAERALRTNEEQLRDSARRLQLAMTAGDLGDLGVGCRERSHVAEPARRADVRPHSECAGDTRAAARPRSRGRCRSHPQRVRSRAQRAHRLQRRVPHRSSLRRHLLGARARSWRLFGSGCDRRHDRRRSGHHGAPSRRRAARLSRRDRGILDGRDRQQDAPEHHHDLESRRRAHVRLQGR